MSPEERDSAVKRLVDFEMDECRTSLSGVACCCLALSLISPGSTLTAVTRPDPSGRVLLAQMDIRALGGRGSRLLNDRGLMNKRVSSSSCHRLSCKILTCLPGLPPTPGTTWRMLGLWRDRRCHHLHCPRRRGWWTVQRHERDYSQRKKRVGSRGYCLTPGWRMSYSVGLQWTSLRTSLGPHLG